MFNEFIQKIKNKEPFSFSRFGDGEWASILNARTEPGAKNADGHAFFPEMGEALRQVLLSKPKYYLGMQRFALEDRYPEEIKKFIEDNQLQDIQWCNADVWHHASIKGYFDEFFDTTKDKKIIFVGPDYLTAEFRLSKFPYSLRVSVPDKDCWLQKDKIVERIKDTLSLYNEKDQEGEIVLFCASMPAKVMIHELYQQFGHQHTLIDCGSVFDPYVGKASRSYHKKIIERLNEGKG